jgi:hypothetical protein
MDYYTLFYISISLSFSLIAKLGTWDTLINQKIMLTLHGYLYEINTDIDTLDNIISQRICK